MIRIANAPCSWGIIENIEGDHGAYLQVLDEMVATGYAGTELGDWGFMPTDPVLLQETLSARGLALLGSWVTVALHDPARLQQDLADCLRTARLLADVGDTEAFIIFGNDPYTHPQRTLHAGRITPALGLPPAAWQSATQGADLIASRVREETGLRCLIHHHIGTWIETPDETRRFLNATNPDLVGLCFDTGHYRYGGGDPLAGLREHRDRIWHVHFKDCDPAIAAQARREGWDGVTAVGRGVFCELGQGEVDFSAVLKELRQTHYAGWIVVEQDVLPGMGTPKESAARNRTYLRSLGL